MKITTLAINTASSRSAIALFEIINKSEVKIIAENSWPAENREAENLMPGISDLLKKSKQSFEDVKQVYVIKGPGSFTGLRVGITVANTIAYLNKCELFGIGTFDYWHSTQNLPLLIYAGSRGVYFRKSAGSDIKLINVEELKIILETEKISEVFGDITNSQKTFLGSTRFIDTAKSFAEIMEKIIQENFHKQNLQNSKIIEPVYIKEPGITQSKKFSQPQVLIDN